jgi:hypothetical protein
MTGPEKFITAAIAAIKNVECLHHRVERDRTSKIEANELPCVTAHLGRITARASALDELETNLEIILRIFTDAPIDGKHGARDISELAMQIVAALYADVSVSHECATITEAQLSDPEQQDGMGFMLMIILGVQLQTDRAFNLTWEPPNHAG